MHFFSVDMKQQSIRYFPEKIHLFGNSRKLQFFGLQPQGAKSKFPRAKEEEAFTEKKRKLEWL